MPANFSFDGCLNMTANTGLLAAKMVLCSAVHGSDKSVGFSVESWIYLNIAIFSGNFLREYFFLFGVDKCSFHSHIVGGMRTTFQPETDIVMKQVPSHSSLIMNLDGWKFSRSQTFPWTSEFVILNGPFEIDWLARPPSGTNLKLADEKIKVTIGQQV